MELKEKNFFIIELEIRDQNLKEVSSKAFEYVSNDWRKDSVSKNLYGLYAAEVNTKNNN